MTSVQRSVEIDHYRPGDIVWMFDMSKIRKVEVEEVQIRIKDDVTEATHLVRSLETYTYEREGGLTLRPSTDDIWGDRVMWQWPRTEQLHLTRDGAFADMIERFQSFARAAT